MVSSKRVRQPLELAGLTSGRRRSARVAAAATSCKVSPQGAHQATLPAGAIHWLVKCRT